MNPPFRLQLLAVAQHYSKAGVHEQGGNNRGPEVEHFLRVVDVPPGEPWCAAAVVAWACEAYLRQAPAKTDFPAAKVWLKANYFEPSASVAAIESNAKKRGTFKPKTWTATPGNLVIYHFQSGHHIGVVDQLEGKTLYAIEGNTGGGSERDGDGVFRKKRDLTYVAGFVDLGNQ